MRLDTGIKGFSCAFFVIFFSFNFRTWMFFRKLQQIRNTFEHSIFVPFDTVRFEDLKFFKIYSAVVFMMTNHKPPFETFSFFAVAWGHSRAFWYFFKRLFLNSIDKYHIRAYIIFSHINIKQENCRMGTYQIDI